ncbi:MAG: ATP-binding protein [Proteobacteria bacterium]|nr:ATP-binding protein [Pseudomonadota bacterium]
MIQSRNWARRLLEDHAIRDDDVLRLVRLSDTCADAPLTVDVLRAALDKQYARLKKLTPDPASPHSSALSRNITALAGLLKLGRDEQAVLRVAATITVVKDLFRDLFNAAGAATDERYAAIAGVAGLSAHRLRAALARKGMLHCCGILEPSEDYEGLSDYPWAVVRSVWMRTLLTPKLDAQQILRSLLRPAAKPQLAMADFAHIGQAQIVADYVRAAMRERHVGVNILVHGAPGTGKTEYVRACAHALGAALYEVPNEDGDGDPISGIARFGAYAACQRILAQGREQMLLFDEVEDVFGNDSSCSLPGLVFRGWRDPETLRKSWINEVLESNPAPTFWVCNSIDGVNPAFARRFDLAVEFRAPGRKARRKVIDRYFGHGTISATCAERLADIADLAPAQVERAARVARTLRTRDPAQRDAQVESIVQSSLRAMGHTATLPAPRLPAHYDPAFLHADRDLSAIAQGLRTRSSARLCLYGPPGTGKTAFAHHLGRELDRPVLVRRASDLLSMWVGGTEANIRKAFEQARDDGAILVIDEADGFLRDRAGAQASWQVSQVNELLTQMEAYEGIFVASTNIVETLDAASLRRFDFKIRFDALRREQRRALLARVCGVDPAATPSDAWAAACTQLDRLDTLTPGDFANVLRQLEVSGEAPELNRVVKLLAAEAAMKPGAGKRAIGFAVGG